MPTDDSPADEAVGQLRLPDDLGSPRLLVKLAEAVHAALRAVLSIEEHEIREQLVLDSRRSQPLDPHTLPNPTNTTPKVGG